MRNLWSLVGGLWHQASEESTSVRWVGQVEANSCAIACLAMVLGVDYAEARGRVPIFNPAEGMVMGQVLRVLTEAGWAYQEKWPDYSPTGHRRPHWPLRPWAPLHVCAVRTNMWHCVVMLDGGMVLDPLAPGPRDLHSYPEVFQIVGLWRVQ
ncbi:MAG TPA: hypothetical protein VFR37_08520 [Longimicrobium sp.]|nr:hypothetical protein [Longimicrobium sp.]